MFVRTARVIPCLDVDRGRVVKGGRTIGLVECDIVDEKQRLVARASSTVMTLRGEHASGR